jgi:hypothetical protein
LHTKAKGKMNAVKFASLSFAMSSAEFLTVIP